MAYSNGENMEVTYQSQFREKSRHILASWLLILAEKTNRNRSFLHSWTCFTASKSSYLCKNIPFFSQFIFKNYSNLPQSQNIPYLRKFRERHCCHYSLKTIWDNHFSCSGAVVSTSTCHVNSVLMGFKLWHPCLSFPVMHLKWPD